MLPSLLLLNIVLELLANAVRKEKKRKQETVYWEGDNNDYWKMKQLSKRKFIKMRVQEATKINR